MMSMNSNSKTRGTKCYEKVKMCDVTMCARGGGGEFTELSYFTAICFIDVLYRTVYSSPVLQQLNWRIIAC